MDTLVEPLPSDVHSSTSKSAIVLTAHIRSWLVY